MQQLSWHCLPVGLSAGSQHDSDKAEPYGLRKRMVRGYEESDEAQKELIGKAVMGDVGKAGPSVRDAKDLFLVVLGGGYVGQPGLEC